MAMRTASPWWASLVFGLGLMFVIIGERLFGHISAARVFFTGMVGLVPILAVTALRTWTTLRTTGNRRAPDEDPIQSQIGMQHKPPRRGGLDHVRVRAVVAAEGETSRRRVFGTRRTDLAFIVFDIGGLTQSSVALNG